MAKTQALICPYCGDLQPTGRRCRSCGGYLDPLSRQASLNAMGPWSFRDPARPFQPGCSYATMVRLIEAGRVRKNTIVRGPSTRQLWTVAKRAPGIAHLLGYCHNCNTRVDPNDFGCSKCGEPFGAYLDRNHLGLPEIRPLPGEPDGQDDDAAAWSGAAGSPPPWSPRDARTGISSFATDEELRASSPDGADSTRNGAAPPPPGNEAHIGAENEAVSEAPAAAVSTLERPASRANQSPAGLSPDMLLMSPAVRSMQRRLASQERTIRALAMLLVVAIVGIASLLAAGVQLNKRLNEAPARQAVPPTPPAATEEPARDAAAVAETPVDDEPLMGRPGDGIDEPPAQLTDEPDSSVDGPPTPPAEPDLTRINELIAIGEDGTRSRSDRLAAYDEARIALRLLLERDDWPDKTRAELQSLLDDVEQAVDRLELGRFFNGGSNAILPS